MKKFLTEIGIALHGAFAEFARWARCLFDWPNLWTRAITIYVIMWATREAAGIIDTLKKAFLDKNPLLSSQTELFEYALHALFGLIACVVFFYTCRKGFEKLGESLGGLAAAMFNRFLPPSLRSTWNASDDANKQLPPPPASSPPNSSPQGT